MDAPGREQVVRLTRDLVRASSAFGAGIQARSGLHGTDLRALRLLDELAGREEDPPTPGSLGRELELSSPATTALLDRLERAGLVERARDPADRRRVLLRLTPAARRIGAERMRPLAAAIDTAAAGLTDAEAGATARYLRQLLESWPAEPPATAREQPDPGDRPG